jgi:3-hydroxymyristoyl/3-hydroxydecanoyl-(acyl carrier protein) dehydratase
MSQQPEVLAREINAHRGEWQLHIPADLEYFAGHFEQLPILPGVVQIDWAIRFAREAFAIQNSFAALDALKFQSLVQPLTRLTLNMEWDIATARLAFSYHDSAIPTRRFSSGRVLFEAGI